jgi:hypothetical protein
VNGNSATSTLQRTDAKVAPAAWIAWVLLFSVAAGAEPPTRPREYSPGRYSTTTGAAMPDRVPKVVVHHAVLGSPNGVLVGRVIPPPGSAGLKAVANLRVALVQDKRAVAMTKTDRSGRFAISNLSEGLFEVVVDGPGSPSRRTCRVWAPSSAPPTARNQMDMILGEGIVRGQGPFPILSFPQAAAVTGVVAGAIAAPVIYHNVRSSNRGPASP